MNGMNAREIQMNGFETDFNHIFKPLSESEYKEFKQGQQDAKNGVKHQDKSKAYTEGYRTQYAWEAKR